MEEIKTAEGGSLIKIPIEDEVKQAYIDYSMSVIVQRALPDVRDGLKQRNVLPSLVKFWDTIILMEMLPFMMLWFVLDRILHSVIQQ